MSLVLAGTADSITYVLDATPATNQLPASIYYALQGGNGNQANTLSNGTTPVTILVGSVTAPIVVNSLVIPNRDTATRTVTVNMVTGAGTFEQAQVILASGSHLNYSSGNGWYVMDKNGNFLETVTVTGGTSTVNQGTANTLSNAWPVEVTDGTNILGTAAHPIRIDTTGTTIQPVSGTVTANAGTGNFGVNLTQLNSVALGSPSNYGTSPGAVSAQGVNAFITNVPAVSQSGSWTVTLGAGAATIGAVNQGTSPWVVSLTSTTITGTVAVTQSTNPWTIQGDSASGAANAGNPVKASAVFNTTQPTVTTGQTVDNQATARGAQIVATGVDIFSVSVSNFPATQPVSGTVAVTQSTSPWVVSLTSTTITGTVAVTQSTTPWTIQGDSASGASNAGNPVKVGGVFNTTQPTVTNGQTVDGQFTARGALLVATGVDALTVTPPANASTNITQWNSVSLGSPTTYGTAPTGNAPGVNSYVTNTGQHGIASAVSSIGFVASTRNWGAITTLYLNWMRVDYFSAVIGTAINVMFKDGSGNVLLNFTLPINATALSTAEVLWFTSMALPLSNGGVSPTVVMTGVLTSGSIGFSFGYS